MKTKEERFNDVIAQFKITSPPSGKKESRASICRQIYEAGFLIDVPLLPPKSTQKRRVGTKHVPRSAPIYDFLARKFRALGFSWEAFSEKGRNRSGREITKHGVRFQNFPTLKGRELSLWELILIPVDLVDQTALVGGGGWEMDTPEIKSQPASAQVSHGEALDNQSPCSPARTDSLRQIERGPGWGWDVFDD